jgi:hypothetical protein
MQKQLIVLLFCLVTQVALTAQFVDLGFTLGGMFYSGDVSPSDPRTMIQDTRPAGGIFCRLSPAKSISTRFSLNFGSIQGDDSRSSAPDREFAFRTNITEFTAIAEWHAWRIRHTEHSSTYPYLFGGVGLFRFNPQGRLNGEWIDLQPLGTEGQGIPGYEEPYARTQFCVPFGAGIKFVVREFTVGFEFGSRLLRTDFLDDISSAVVSHREVFENNGPVAAYFNWPPYEFGTTGNRNRFRGTDNNDWYYMMNITVSYNFGTAINKMLSNPVPSPSW